MSRSSASSTSEILRAHCAAIAEEEAVLREGGGKAGHERQGKMGRLPVRERLNHLLDKNSPFFEIGLWAAYKIYEQHKEPPFSRCPVQTNSAALAAMSSTPSHFFSSKKLCIKTEFVEKVDPILRTKSNAFGCVMCGPPHTA
jgi:hypothetical protein